ncbi:MAG: MutS family DNA mismatch repair protein [Anaerolineae bacterium]
MMLKETLATHLTDRTLPVKSQRYQVLWRQTERLSALIEAARTRSDQLATLRGWLAVGIVAAAALTFAATLSVPWMLIVGGITTGAFSAAVMIHARVKQSALQFYTWRKIRRAHLARMRLDWANIPDPTNFPPIFEHPFENDLDITGKRSVHHLIDTSITEYGSLRLRDSLLGMPQALTMSQVLARQRLVRELVPLQSFRDRLVLLYQTLSRGDERCWQTQRLVEWLDRHTGAPETKGRLRVSLGQLIPLSLINIGVTLLAGSGILPAWAVGLSFILYFGRFLAARQLAGDLFSEASALDELIQRLYSILGFLEARKFSRQPELKLLCTPLHQNKPSHYLRQIQRTLAALGVSANPFLWLAINIVLPYDIFFGVRLLRHKDDLAQHLPQWLDALYTLEAAASLANHAYLNPHHTFPQFTASFSLHGLQMGHVLIEDRVKIRNDFSFDHLGQIALITGSNMAGKSSFLRAIGLNLVLAYAGGTVDADHLQVGLFRLITCIRVADSVADGFSYFYAEVRRLRYLLDALKDQQAQPVFFLVDEIFRGTNNRERLIGSRAYIRELANGNGFGAISTHDLELTKLEGDVPHLSNWHFREEVIGGQMVFDYRIRRGPSPTTNALRIMQLAGLPVEID